MEGNEMFTFLKNIVSQLGKKGLRETLFGSDDPTQVPEDWRFISASQFFIFYVFFVVVVTVLAYLLLTIATVTCVWAANWFLGSELKITWYMHLALAAMAIYVNIPQGGGATFTVPNQHVAVLTLFGQRTAWFLLEGNYPNITGGFFIGRSTEAVDDFTTTADSPNGPGFVNMGRLSLQLWHDMKNKETVLKNVARNASEVLSQVLIVLQVRNPNAVLSADEPSKEAFERARTAFRSATAFFTDKDNAFVKTILVKLMMGKTIITAFVNTQETTNYENGSVIRDFGGKALMMEVDDLADDQTVAEIMSERDVTEEQMQPFLRESYSDSAAKEKAQRAAIMKVLVERAKTKFRKLLEEQADKNMLKLVPRVKNGKQTKASTGELLVYDKSVDQSLEEVLVPNGIALISASVSNVQFSQPVSDAAAKAASEVYEAQSMRDSAIAQVKAEEAMLTERKRVEKKTGRKTDELDRVLVGAQDNDNIRIIHTSGSGGELSKAASIINEGKE